MAATGKHGQARSANSKCPRFQGNPGGLVAAAWAFGVSPVERTDGSLDGPLRLLPGSQPAVRTAGTVIPAIAALTGDHPPGDKRDEEKGEEDLERPERS